MIMDLFRDRSLDFSDSFYQARRSFELDPNQRFVDVKNRIGLIPASHYAQLFFFNQTRYKKFRRQLDLHSQNRNALNREYDVLIVLPPRGSLPHRITEGFLRQSMGLATSAGFNHVSRAQLNTDRVLHGAHRLQKLIEEKHKAGRKLIILSFSYGSAFVRVMLDRCTKEETSHIQGWANVSGMIFGCPLFHCSDKRSFFQRNSPAQRTFSSEQKYFVQPMKDHGIHTIHFLGMKNNDTQSLQELRAKQRLKAWGPSDGLIPFAPYQNLPHTVVPLVDQGHGVDLSGFSMTFVRSLSSMVSTLPITKIK